MIEKILSQYRKEYPFEPGEDSANRDRYYWLSGFLRQFDFDAPNPVTFGDLKKELSHFVASENGWLSNDLAQGARVISREENESLKILSTPQIPALQNAVNRQARINELVYLARKAGKTEGEISECLSDILSPLSVEQRLNKLIG